MDDRRFDDLTRNLAVSRRGAIRFLGGCSAAGIMTILGSARISARQGAPWPRPPKPPRPDDCRRRRNGDLCKTGCGVCQDGACVPIADGDPCGECLVCREGACRAVPDKAPCGGDCGICLNGTCQVNDEICEGGNDPCFACDPATFTCAPVRDGFPCGGGNCGVCAEGNCLPDPVQCDLLCATCDPSTLTCQPFPDGTFCNFGACGICEGGQCAPSNDRCLSDCAVCVQQGDVFTCVPTVDGSTCGGDCGICALGLCQPDATRCDLDCQICDPNSLDCIAVGDGLVCGSCRTCQGGACQPASDPTNCVQCYANCCHANDSGACVTPYECCTEVCSTCVLPGQTPPWDFAASGACLRWRNDVVGGYCEERPWTCGVVSPPCYVNGIAVACCGAGFVCGANGCQRA